MGPRRIGTALVIVALAVAVIGCGSGKSKEAVRLNQLQIIGTHNSYHVQMPQQALALMAVYAPDRAKWFEYSHPSLDTQLDAGIRGIELDLYADPKGGLFADRKAMALLNMPVASGIPELSQPGFKVMHMPEVDFQSTCWTLQSCLGSVLAWSNAHPQHLPIFIGIEAKDDSVGAFVHMPADVAPNPDDPLNLGFAQPIKITRAEMEAVENEVLQIVPRNKIITPDDVRGKASTLEEAILKNGWPTLDAARGKLIFWLDDEAAKRDMYRAGNPSLEGRLMFTAASPGDPDAAIVKLDDAVGSAARIGQLARAGYIVRTRADADTLEARSGDTTRRDAALRSGAQIITTDYALGEPSFGTGYSVRLRSGGLVGCDPEAAKKSCDDKAIAEPAGARPEGSAR